MEGIDFWERLDRAGECWTWAGPTDPSGYGVLKVKGTLWKAHRLAWSLDRGIEPPAGVPILQTCQNRACCRPEHLVQGPSHRRQRKARRPSGSGSLEELRPGVWQLRVSVGKGPAGTYERVTRMFEGTSTEAHKALAALVADCAAGRVVAGSETMDTLFDAWLAYLGRIGRSPNYIT
ncbi:MAG: HNH endonuclease, partial [Acidimicrobiales bacterium]